MSKLFEPITPAVADDAQPSVAGADVPVLRHRRRAERLAPGAPRRARHRRLRAGDDRGLRGRVRGADLAAGRGHLERRAGRGLAPGRRLRARPGRARSACSSPMPVARRRPTGRGHERSGTIPADDGGWPTRRSVRGPVRGVRRAGEPLGRPDRRRWCRPSRTPPAGPSRSASTPSRSTQPTATSSTSSSRRSRIGATTTTAAPSRTAPGWSSRWSMRFARRCPTLLPCWCGSPAPTGSRVAGTSSRAPGSAYC